MLCEHCQEREATVHLAQVIDGHVKKLHLCEACAAETGFEVEGVTSVTDILLGMGGTAPAGTSPAAADFERSCPSCHLRKSDFKKAGQFGCPTCYETFEEELAPLLKAMHRGERHAGKIPEREGLRVRVSAELRRLRKALEDAVTEEQSEAAATLRDKIRACEARIESSEREPSA
jgi:protein arginine kinase activator